MEHSPPGSKFTWEGKCHGRHGKQGDDRSIRLEAPSVYLSQDRPIVRSGGSGSIRIQADIPDSSILQLETRPGSSGNRCLPPGLDFKKGLCKSTVGATGQDAVICPSSGSSNYSSCTCLEVPAMVPSSPGDYPRLILDKQIVCSQYPQEFLPQLAVWHISGRDTPVLSFRRKLHRSCLSHGEMTHSLRSGIAGVLNGVQIPFLGL